VKSSIVTESSQVVCFRNKSQEGGVKCTNDLTMESGIFH
jgi:hypothetical protein